MWRWCQRKNRTDAVRSVTCSNTLNNLWCLICTPYEAPGTWLSHLTHQWPVDVTYMLNFYSHEHINGQSMLPTCSVSTLMNAAINGQSMFFMSSTREHRSGQWVLLMPLSMATTILLALHFIRASADQPRHDCYCCTQWSYARKRNG